MNILLDTHTIIWYFEDSHKLPKNTREIIENSENSKFICSVSLFEITIKMGLGKLNLSFAHDELIATVNKSNYGILQVENKYLSVYYTLPMIHKDPFDRLLISTALSENLTIITVSRDTLIV